MIETAQSSLIGLTVAALGLAPLLTPILLVALALLTAAQELVAGHRPHLTLQHALRQPAALACLAFLGYAAMSALWSSEPLFAASTVVRGAVVLIAAAYLVVALRRQIAALDDVRRRRFVRALPLGALVPLAFLLVELLTGNGLSNLAFRLVPGLWAGSAKLIVQVPGSPPRLVSESFVHNRGIAAMVVLAPVLLLSIWMWQRGALRAWLMAAAGLALAAIAWLSESETAKLAVLLGVAALAVAWRRPAGSWRGLAVLCSLGTVLALPLASLPYALDAHNWPSLAFSARERVLIWRNTAVSTLSRPVFGIGVQSTRFQQSDMPAIESPHSIPRSALGWHAHNAFLQTWFELGAVGALALLALLLAGIGALRGLAPRLHPPAIALTTMGIVVLSTGWGMWQPWLLGTLASAIVLVAMLDSALPSDYSSAQGS